MILTCFTAYVLDHTDFFSAKHLGTLFWKVKNWYYYSKLKQVRNKCGLKIFAAFWSSIYESVTVKWILPSSVYCTFTDWSDDTRWAVQGLNVLLVCRGGCLSCLLDTTLFCYAEKKNSLNSAADSGRTCIKTTYLCTQKSVYDVYCLALLMSSVNPGESVR